MARLVLYVPLGQLMRDMASSPLNLIGEQTKATAQEGYKSRGCHLKGVVTLVISLGLQSGMMSQRQQFPPIYASSSTPRGGAGLTWVRADQRRGLGQMGSLEDRPKRVGIFQRTVDGCLLCMTLRRGNSDGFSQSLGIFLACSSGVNHSQE